MLTIREAILETHPDTATNGTSTDPTDPAADPEESAVGKAMKEAVRLSLEAEKNGGATCANADSAERRLLKTVSGFCSSCVSLLDCPLPAKGWRPVPPDQDAREMYGDKPEHALPWSYKNVNPRKLYRCITI